MMALENSARIHAAKTAISCEGRHKAHVDREIKRLALPGGGFYESAIVNGVVHE